MIDTPDDASRSRDASSSVASEQSWTARAHVRVVDGAAIVFDLVADRYLRVPITRHAPAIVLTDAVGVAAPLSAAMSTQLQKAGLVSSLAATQTRGGATAVLLSCAWADRLLRTKRLDKAVARLAQLKLLGRTANGVRSREAFDKWRPLYPHDYFCLVDSLALAHYFLLGGLRPRFIIGVRDAPFSAHAWVALDGVVLNDRLGQWPSYHPILEI